MMKRRTTQRALRLVTGAIISSDLSLSEVTELAHALRKDARFPLDLAHLLIQTVRGLETSHGAIKQPHFGARTHTNRAGLVDDMMTVLNRRRRSKQSVIAWLQEFGGRDAPLLNAAWTLREIVERFVAGAPSEVLERLLGDLGLQEGGVDPYLEGIMKRKAKERT